MIIRLLKAFVQGLLLAACFAGGYYWAVSLKPGDVIRDAGYEMRDDGEKLEDRELSLREPVLSLGVENVDTVGDPEIAEAPTPATVENVDSTSLSVAMRNHLDALRKLRE